MPTVLQEKKGVPCTCEPDCNSGTAAERRVEQPMRGNGYLRASSETADRNDGKPTSRVDRAVSAWNPWKRNFGRGPVRPTRATAVTGWFVSLKLAVSEGLWNPGKGGG